MMFFLPLALVLLALALWLLWQAARRRRSSGLPAGRVVYTDTRGWGKVEKPLFDAELGLTGKPDYLIQQKGGEYIPVEVKSSLAPPLPYQGHIYQLAGYCLLVGRVYGKRPSYGLIQYRNRTFAIDFTSELESSLLRLLEEMRAQGFANPPACSHNEARRCARCGYRLVCDQVVR